MAKGEMAKFFAGMKWRVVKNFDCLEPWESADQERWESEFNLSKFEIPKLVRLKTAAVNSVQEGAGESKNF